MCILVKHEDDVKVAKHDIVCFKDVLPILYATSKWQAPVRGNIYEYNQVLQAQEAGEDVTSLKVNVIELDSLSSESPFYIAAGFHAYSRPLRKSGISVWRSTKRRLAIIPKGSEYCYGETHWNEAAVVGTKMIVFDSIWRFAKYKIHRIVHC